MNKDLLFIIGYIIRQKIWIYKICMSQKIIANHLYQRDNTVYEAV